MKNRIILAALVAVSLLLSACATAPSQRLAETIVAKVDAQPAPPAENAPAVPADLPLRAKIDSDLQNAKDIARAASDAPAVSCWTAVGKWVDTLPLATSAPMADPILPAATGPAGVLELARVKTKLAEARIGAVKARIAALRATIDAGVPDDVVTACAVVVNDARVVRDRVVAAIGLAGIGGAGGVAPAVGGLGGLLLQGAGKLP